MNKVKFKYLSLFGIVGFAAALLYYLLSLALAATSPTLTAALSYSVLAGAKVTNTGLTTVNRDLGVSPSIGVPPHVQDVGTLTVGPPGAIHDADLNAALAQADNTTQFGNLSAVPNVACTTDYGAVVKDLAPVVALTPLVPGIYCANAFILTTGTPLQLNALGNANAVWIFRSAATLGTTSGVGAKVQFLNGVGSSCNVWWKVVSSATLGVGTSFIGNILALTDITLQTNATLNGRAFAQTGTVALDANIITTPLCQAATTTTTTLPSSTSTTLQGTTTTTLQGTTTTTLQGTTTTTLQGTTTTTLQGVTTTTLQGATSSTIVRIPAVGNWGMVILAVVFLGAIAWMVRARRSLR